MSSISSQLDVMREKHEQVAEDLVLGVFCPKCRKKHSLKECPLDKAEVCGLCELEHDTKYFPSLLKAKEVFHESMVDKEHACFISQKNPWKPWVLGMHSEPTPFNSWNNSNNQFPPPYSYPNT